MISIALVFKEYFFISTEDGRANLGDQIYHKPSLSSFADNRERSVGAARYRHVAGSPVKQPAAPQPISAPDFRRRRCGRWRPLAVATVARRDVLRGGLVRESFASLSFYNKRPGEQQLSAHRRRHVRRDVDSSSLDRADNSVRGRRGGEGEEERAKLKSEPTLGDGAPENHNASLRQSRIVKAATAPPDHVASPIVFTLVRSISCARAIAGAELTNSATTSDVGAFISRAQDVMHVHVSLPMEPGCCVSTSRRQRDGEAVIESTSAAIKVSIIVGVILLFICLSVAGDYVTLAHVTAGGERHRN